MALRLPEETPLATSHDLATAPAHSGAAAGCHAAAGDAAVSYPLAWLKLPRPFEQIVDWLAVVVAVWVVSTAVSAIGGGFKLATGDQAGELFQFAANPMIGVLATVLTQSSSTTTSLAVPLAVSGKFILRQLFAFVAGANIGTCVTALVAAFAFSGGECRLALQAAFVHLLYNVFAAVLVLCVPGLNRVPSLAAQKLADLGVRNKLYVVAWVLGIFVVVPCILILVTVVL